MNLLDELMQMTEEEKAILDRKEVSKELYTSQARFIIESEKFLSHDKMIMVRKHTRFVPFPLHKHDYIEMNYVYKGRLQQRVGGREIVLKQGELLLLNQHIEHEIEACGADDLIVNFIIRAEFFDFIFSYLHSKNIMMEFLMNSLYNNTYNGQFLYFQIAQIDEIQAMIQRMIRELMHADAFSESTVKLYMGLLMMELAKHSDKMAQSEGQHLLTIEALQYIEANFKTASLYELAKKTNQSHYGLSKLIKKTTGYTFKELLQEKRLSRAKELLQSTSMPIASVVEQVGYDNISYFYRIFKSKYGQTPKNLRKNVSEQ